jgi:uncharacterized protein YjhX (UPF0386 family)
LKIQYSDAIYHVMARGNGRQDIVEDDADRVRLVACLERAVRRSGWSLYAFVRLTNHLHLVLKTPRPNLFFTRLTSPYGSGKNGYHSIASFTPEETMFQLNVQHVKPIKTA